MQIPRNPIRPIRRDLAVFFAVTAARCQAWRSRHQVQQLQGFWGWCRTKVCDKVLGLNLTRSFFAPWFLLAEKDWKPPKQSSNYILYNYIYIDIYIYVCVCVLQPQLQLKYKRVKNSQNISKRGTLTMPACRSITGTILAASCRWIAPQSWAACKRFQLSSDVSAQQLHAAPSKASPWGLLRVASAFKFFIASSQSGEVGTERKQ